ncbi:MAG: ATP phosphoribosyltransferase [Planctomycetes bacterium]|nr:ATP phosphoribosyltransferase [Planctomycetota bacterium]
MPELKIGLPKGSLQDSTLSLLTQAGWAFNVSSRSYYPTCNDPEISAMLARPQEMSRYVERGVLDMAITGLDWVLENGSEDKVKVLERLVYAKATRQPVRWVLAVPENSNYRTAADLQGKIISTEVVGLTKRYFAEKKVDVQVEFSHGATEVKVPHLADAIVDITETGSSLRANHLRIIDTIQESVTVVIANPKAYSDSWKKPKIDALCLMLKGALDARERVLLKMNAPVRCVPDLLKKLPSLNSPTVNKLADENWVAIETIIEETQVRTLIPELKLSGAEGIIELPLNKVIR